MEPAHDQGGKVVSNVSEHLEEPRSSSFADLLVASILIALSIVVTALGERMPRPRGWGASPGLLPVVTGIILFGLGVLLAFSAFRSKKTKTPVFLQQMSREEKAKYVDITKRICLVIGSILFYIAVMVPIIGYTTSTFVYLFGTIWFFWKGKLYKILLISVGGTLFYSLVFPWFFQIFLP